MSNTTKRIFILSLVTAIITLSSFAYIYYKISQQGLLLEEQISILKESDTKESAYIKLKRQAQETETKRSLLADSFFRQEGDSIVFLGETETLASSLGLSFKTESLSTVVNKDTNQEFVQMTFSYVGKKDTVLNFSKLMENIPYHSKVSSLSLNQRDGGKWEGELTILITINSL